MLRNAKPNASPLPKNGFALILVLWALLLAGILGLSLAETSRSGAELTRANLERAQAEALADAGVHQAAFRLLTEELDDPLFQRSFKIAIPAGTVSVSIEDEEGKIDLNTASPELLRGLFIAAGAEPKAADELFDAFLARRADDAPPLRSIVQLRTFDRVDQDLFQRIEHAITVANQGDGLDPSVADRLAILAVPSVSGEIADRLVDGEDYFAIGGLDEAEPYFFRSRQQNYTIRAEATTESGARFQRIAVIGIGNRGGAPFSILDWRQGSQ